MTAEINLQHLFLLPLPVTAPGLNARLGGLIIKRCDGMLNALGKAEFAGMKLPAHLLPSPVYLLKQDLNPQLFKRGMSEYELYAHVQELLAPAHVLPVVFGYKYLFYLNAAALRCFKEPDLFFKKDVLDLKVALQAARLFGSLQERRLPAEALSSLHAAAEVLGFKGPDGLLSRADALPFVLQFLRTHDLPILQFCLKGRTERLRRLEQSLKSGSLVVYCDGSEFAAARCTDLKEDQAELVCCTRDYSVKRIKLDLSAPVLIAPQGVLTLPRQEHLGFDLNKAAALLSDAALAQEPPEDQRRPLLRELFMGKLSAKEQELFHDIGSRNPQLLPPAPLWAGEFFKELYFLYQADNFQASLIDSELNAYRLLCRRHLARHLPLYLKETQTAASLLDEDDVKGQELFLQIARFPETL